MLNPLIISKIQFIILIEFYLSSNDVHSLYIWDVIRDNEHTREVFEEMTPGITYKWPRPFTFIAFILPL